MSAPKFNMLQEVVKPNIITAMTYIDKLDSNMISSKKHTELAKAYFDKAVNNMSIAKIVYYTKVPSTCFDDNIHTLFIKFELFADAFLTAYIGDDDYSYVIEELIALRAIYDEIK